MNYLRYVKAALFTLLVASNALANTNRLMINSSVFSPEKLGQIALGHDENGFRVVQNGECHEVRKYHVDPVLRNISGDQLKAFLKHGYISVNQFDDGEFTLKAHVRGLGGGGLAGYWAYMATKAFCYGTAVAATSAAVVATGGAAGAVTGVLAAGSTAGATTGATMVGAAIAGAGLTSEAALATAGAASVAGGFAGAAAMIECTAIAVGGIFASIPFLP